MAEKEPVRYNTVRMNRDTAEAYRFFGGVRQYTGYLLRPPYTGGRPSKYCQCRLDVLRDALGVYNQIFCTDVVDWESFVGPDPVGRNTVFARAGAGTPDPVNARYLAIARLSAALMNNGVPVWSLVTLDLRDLNVYGRTIRYTYDTSAVEWDECRMFGQMCVLCGVSLEKHESKSWRAAQREVDPADHKLVGFTCRRCHHGVRWWTRTGVKFKDALEMVRNDTKGLFRKAVEKERSPKQ